MNNDNTVACEMGSGGTRFWKLSFCDLFIHQFESSLFCKQHKMIVINIPLCNRVL